MSHLSFYLSQIMIVLFAWFVGFKEVVFIRAMREYVPINNPYLEPFHAYGFGAVVVPVLLSTIYQGCIAGYVLIPFLSLVLYKLIFDGVIGQEIYNDWKYVGFSAKSDKILRKWFGPKCGLRKVQIGIAAIVILNIIYLVFS
jgi:hypothetical protein